MKVAEHNGEGGLWKAGFRFTQRGIPDEHRVISTQTGGAGAILFPDDPDHGGHGEATQGSAVFHIDDLGAAPEPHYTITLAKRRVTYERDRGSLLQTVLKMRGTVTSSTDDRCDVGAGVTVTLEERHNPSHPSLVELYGTKTPPVCLVNEAWTSTDKRRVSVHVSLPQRVG